MLVLKVLVVYFNGFSQCDNSFELCTPKGFEEVKVEEECCAKCKPSGCIYQGSNNTIQLLKVHFLLFLIFYFRQIIFSVL